MVGGGRAVNLSESLFEVEEESFPPDEGPSAAMRALVDEVESRQARRKKKSKTIAASVFNRALVEVDQMIASGDWAGATARHLVALYDRMHVKCYGVEPEELGAGERYNAALLAGNMVKHKFGGDVVACVEYMRWAWTREIGRERWRRENGREGGRLGVRLVFGGHLLTDYRLALARERSKP